MKRKLAFALALLALALTMLLPSEAGYYWRVVGIPGTASNYVNNGLGNYMILANDDPSVEFAAITLYDIRRDVTDGTRLFRHDLQRTHAFYDGNLPGSVDIDLTLPIKDDDGNAYTLVRFSPQAFKGNTYLRSIKLPSTLEAIGNYAFQEAVNLERVDFSATDTTLKSIGTVVFNSCKKLSYVEWPTHLTEIPDYTFEYSGIVGVSALGAIRIGTRAFGGAASFQALELGDTATGMTCGVQTFQNINTADIRKRLLFHGTPPVVNDVFAGTSNGVVDWLSIGMSADFYIPFNGAKDGPTDGWTAFKKDYEAYKSGNEVVFPTYDAATGAWTPGYIYSKPHDRRVGLVFWDPDATTSAALLVR